MTTESEQAKPVDGEARRAERTHLRNAVQRELNKRDAQEASAKQHRQHKVSDTRTAVKERIGVTSHLPGHPYMQRTALAVANAHGTVEKALDAIGALYASPMVTPAQLVLATAERANAAIEAASKEIGEARATLKDTGYRVAERIEKALTTPTQHATDVSDIRAALRAMPQEQRYDALANGGDDHQLLLYAVAGVPGFVTGVAEGKRVEMRLTLLAIRDPDLLVLEKGIPAALAALDKAEAGVRSLFEEVVDFKAAAALKGGV